MIFPTYLYKIKYNELVNKGSITYNNNYLLYLRSYYRRSYRGRYILNNINNNLKKESRKVMSI